MNASRTTLLLVVLLVLSAAAAAVALPAMSSAKQAALEARNDLAEVRAALGAMAPTPAPSATTSPAPRPAAAAGDASASVRAAATRAGIDPALAGIEPLRQGSSGSVLLVRFDPIALRRLTEFLRELRAQDPEMRADAIELSAAAAAAAPDQASRDERWSATVTLAVPASR